MSVGVFFFCDGGEVAERRWVGGAWVVSAAICTRGILIRGDPSPVEVGCENSRTQVVAETVQKHPVSAAPPPKGS